MGRSVKKGPFVHEKLLKRIVEMNEAGEKRVLKTFLLTSLMSFVAITVLSIVMIIVLSINGVKLTSTSLVLSNSVFMSVVLTGIVVYSIISATFYLLTKKEFNKGVNVD